MHWDGGQRHRDMRLGLVGLLADGLDDGGVAVGTRAVDLDRFGAEAKASVKGLLFLGRKRRKGDCAVWGWWRLDGLGGFTSHFL